MTSFKLDGYRAPKFSREDLLRIRKKERTQIVFLDVNFLNQRLPRRFLELLRAFWITVIAGTPFLALIALLVSFAIDKTFLETVRSALITKEGSLSSGFLSMVLAPIGVYWSLDAIFGRRWSYCAGLYNELVKMKTNAAPKGIDEDLLLRTKEEYLEALIAYDLIDLDLYHHKSFHEFFSNVLEKALEAQQRSMSGFTEDLLNSTVTVENIKTMMGRYLFHRNKLMEAQRAEYAKKQAEATKRIIQDTVSDEILRLLEERGSSAGSKAS